jgi:hypothetical protein
MTEGKQGGEARGDWRETAADDATVVAPRFDEREAATARPVVPLGGSENVGTGGSGGFSVRANARHLLLAWAVIATLAAGGVAVYKSAQTSEPQTAPQSTPESTASGAVAATPQPARREVPVAPPPARAAKMTEARALSPSWEVPDWSDSGEVKRDERDEEELDERARKEERRRRKEEKKRREEAEEEAEEKAERARKAARKQAERRRERQKDGGRKAQLVGVLTEQD